MDIELIDPFAIRLGGVKRTVADGKLKTLRATRELRKGPITDTVAEISGWACFNEERRRRANRASKTAGGNQVKEAKIGRNDPCP